ncbi:MAG: XdhC family protein [Planctomycetes bacterium]|nr:XdhC family protein [Planctomycetota bacterium]
MRNEAVYEGIRELRESGINGVLATVVGLRGSSPGALGSKMLIARDGRTWGTVGGGCVDGQVYAELNEVIATERPKTFTLDLSENDDPDHGLICGGQVEVFLEPIVTTHLIICGSGHIAHSLADLAQKLDFEVSVMDDRKRFLNAERYPGCRLLLGDFEDLLANHTAPEGAYVAIVTRGHRYDQECLEWALAQANPHYIGLVGSRSKIHAIVKRAADKGHRPEDLAKVRAPIGLDLGSVTVEEIAVSIAAELVAVRRRGPDASRTLENPGSLSDREQKLQRAPSPLRVKVSPSATPAPSVKVRLKPEAEGPAPAPEAQQAPSPAPAEEAEAGAPSETSS